MASQDEGKGHGLLGKIKKVGQTLKDELGVARKHQTHGNPAPPAGVRQGAAVPDTGVAPAPSAGTGTGNYPASNNPQQASATPGGSLLGAEQSAQAPPSGANEYNVRQDPVLAPTLQEGQGFPGPAGAVTPRTAPGEQETYGEQGTRGSVLAPVSEGYGGPGYGAGGGDSGQVTSGVGGGGGEYREEADPVLNPIMPEGHGFSGQPGELAPKTAPGEQERFGEQGVTDGVLAPVTQKILGGGYGAGTGDSVQAPSGAGPAGEYREEADPMLNPLMPEGQGFGRAGELAPKTAPGEQEAFGEQGTMDPVLAPVSQGIPAGGYVAGGGDSGQAPFGGGPGAREYREYREEADPMLAPTMPEGQGFPGRPGELAPKTAPGEQEAFGKQGTTDPVLAPVGTGLPSEEGAPAGEAPPPAEMGGPYGAATDTSPLNQPSGGGGGGGGPYGATPDAAELERSPENAYGADGVAPPGGAARGQVKHFAQRDAEGGPPGTLTQQALATAGGIRDRAAGALGFYDNGSAEPQTGGGGPPPVESSDPAASWGPSITQRVADAYAGVRDSLAVNLGFVDRPNRSGDAGGGAGLQQPPAPLQGQPLSDSAAAGVEPGLVTEEGGNAQSWDRPSALVSEAVQHNMPGDVPGSGGPTSGASATYIPSQP